MSSRKRFWKVWRAWDSFAGRLRLSERGPSRDLATQNRRSASWLGTGARAVAIDVSRNGVDESTLRPARPSGALTHRQPGRSDPGREMETREFWRFSASVPVQTPQRNRRCIPCGASSDGMTADEVQEVLGITRANFWKRLHRCANVVAKNVSRRAGSASGQKPPPSLPGKVRLTNGAVRVVFGTSSISPAKRWLASPRNRLIATWAGSSGWLCGRTSSTALLAGVT